MLAAFLALISTAAPCSCAQPTANASPQPQDPKPARLLVEPIRPYVLSLGTDHATICWLTTAPCIGKVTLSGYSDQQDYVEEGPAGYMHKVTMRDLAPASTYRYQIGRNYEGTFTTANTTSSFEVAVFGHPGGTENAIEYPTELLQGRLLSISPELALCTGDISLYPTVRGLRDTFIRRFDQFMASRPIYIAPANHEGLASGADYSNFRLLFPHEFGPKSGGSYWFDYQHVRFYALTYRLKTPEQFREHVAWLTDAIDKSDQEFNIVFMGGHDPAYYDKDYLFEQLSSRPVELVLGGDGGRLFQENNHGVDFFFAGDGSTTAYPFYYLRFHPHHFDVQLHFSDGTRKSKTYRSFYSKKKRKVLRQLAPLQAKSKKHVLQYRGIEEPSTKVDGVHMTIDWPHDIDVELQVLMKPKNSRRSKRQTHLVKAKSRTEVLVDLPEWSPTMLAGTVYVLEDLDIQLATHRPYHKKYDLQKAISDVYLFGR